jgi:hypothetical protein
MTRFVAVTLAITLAGCGSTQKPPGTQPQAGEAKRVAVGGQMVSHTATTVRVVPLVPKPRVDGTRAEFVYLGLLGSDPAGRSIIRVKYELHEIVDGVENPAPSHRAEVQLDLRLGRTIEFEDWRIDVIDATESSIQFAVVGIPAR